jgi:uncharacterized protein
MSKKPFWYEPPIAWRDDSEERSMEKEFELRFAARPNLRAAVADDGVRKLTGYASRYNVLSKDIGAMLKGPSWYERILPGAFEGILATNPDVRLTLDHDPVSTFARTTAGTLKLSSDKKGLAFEAVLPDTTAARDLHTNVRAGNLTECSFTFSKPDAEWTEETAADGSRISVRNIKGFNGVLSDICVCPTGAYGGTEVHARAMRDAADDDDETLEDAAEDEFDLFSPDYDPDKECDGHTDDGDCNDPRCACQNRMSQSKLDRLHDVLTRSARRSASGTIRTKRVDGKDLPASAFAFVGDPDKTETWKLPIHDADHVRNALARFDQTEGLGDKKAAVKAKIMAAAKKFGIDASGDRSARLIAVSDRIIRDMDGQRKADEARERRRKLFDALVLG